MLQEEFQILLTKLAPYTDYLYFHLMGEPFLHPQLFNFLTVASEQGFRCCLTTNGTLLRENGEFLFNNKSIHKISISLQAQEVNQTLRGKSSYLEDCFSLGQKIGTQTIVVYRLWNEGGADSDNPKILAKLKEFFPEPWVKQRSGFRLADKVYLEFGELFSWPTLEASKQLLEEPFKEAFMEPLGNQTSLAEQSSQKVEFCYGLRDQLGVLVDGTVVPCCLDYNGEITLGNLFQEDLSEILLGSRAQALYQGFSNRNPSEKLCQTCGFATRFTK